MAERGIHIVRAHLAKLPPSDSLTIAERRAQYERAEKVFPTPPEVKVERVTVPTAPAEWLRPPSAAPGRVMLYLHGGGYVIGSPRSHRHLAAAIATAAGSSALLLEYRCAPEAPFPAAVDDCWAATRYVAEHARELDVHGIALGGDSAGGNLAATVALLARDQNGPALAFQLLIYPATDQRCATASHERNAQGYLLTRDAIQYFRRAYLPQESDWLDWRASPLLAKSHANLPPAFVITAGFDPLLDEGRAYADKLRAAGVEVAYREYADMVHGFVLFGGVLDTANAAVADCCSALRHAFESVAA